jgi:type I restriction enzyme S subunit
MTFEKVDLGTVCTFFNNSRKPVTRSSRVAGEYRYFGAAGIQDYVSEYLFDGDFILVGEDGTVITEDDRPVVQQVSGKFWVNNHAHVIQPNEMEDYDSLYFAISSTKVRDLVTGAVQPKLSMTNLKQLQIPWAEDSVTRLTIGSILRSLDEKIAANNALSKTLEAIAQTIFKSWFIDFDPVKAKMAGKNPAGMDAATAELFPDSMEDSELGEIPARWQVASLGSIASIHQGKYLKPSDMSPTRSVEFPNPVEGATKIIGYSTKSTFNFNFSSVSCRGSCGFVRWICSPAWISNNLMAIHGKGEEEINHYLHFLLKSINFESVTTGSVQGQITITNLSSLRVIHNIKLAKRFSEMIEPIHEAISTLERQSAALAEIRDTLMPRLISGELQIPEEMLAS